MVASLTTILKTKGIKLCINHQLSSNVFKCVWYIIMPTVYITITFQKLKHCSVIMEIIQICGCRYCFKTEHTWLQKLNKSICVTKMPILQKTAIELWNKFCAFETFFHLTCSANCDRSTVITKLHHPGPHTYNVLSVRYKRSQLRTGCVLNFLKTFTSTAHSVADLILCYEAFHILWRLPRYRYSCTTDTISFQTDWRRNY